jgi:hypothetical protein
MKRRTITLAIVTGALAMSTAHARVTRIVIDETVPLPAADCGGVACEQLAGRAFGELDPRLRPTPSSTTSRSRRIRRQSPLRDDVHSD